MRYIPLLKQKPGHCPEDPENEKMIQRLAKAKEYLEEMEAAQGDEEQIKAIIEKHAGFWGEYKEWLLRLSHGKCWFSEAKDCISHWEVEHFRPKKSVRERDNSPAMGYWWLAFDWRNFRICGNVPNRNKGAYFPLREGSQRVKPKEDFRLEEQVLLDPADPYDPTLISFDMLGNAIPKPGLGDNWEKDRVRYSIERYSLNDYQPLVDKRKIVWSECSTQIDLYLEECNTYFCTRSPIARQGMRERVQTIRAMLQEDQEFSTVAHACLKARSVNEPRLQGLDSN